MIKKLSELTTDERIRLIKHVDISISDKATDYFYDVACFWVDEELDNAPIGTEYEFSGTYRDDFCFNWKWGTTPGEIIEFLNGLDDTFDYFYTNKDLLNKLNRMRNAYWHGINVDCSAENWERINDRIEELIKEAEEFITKRTTSYFTYAYSDEAIEEYIEECYFEDCEFDYYNDYVKTREFENGIYKVYRYNKEQLIPARYIPGYEEEIA